MGWAETNPGSTSRWLPFEHGKTIGTEGSEFGEIVLDEELALVGRVTLERLPQPSARALGDHVWRLWDHSSHHLLR